MSQILIRPQDLRQSAEHLRNAAKKIDAALQAIDQEILSLKSDKFLGHRANAVQSRYAPKREALLKAKGLIAHFVEDLQNTATRFEQADKNSGAFPSIPLHPAPTPAPIGPANPVTPSPSIVDSITTKKIKDAISSLNVAKNPKYQPRDGKTYCNIFAMDFCRKMGVPFPEWLDWNKDGIIDDYLDANEAISWLNGSYNKGGVQTGADLGWKIVSADQAAQYASSGKVVLAGWTNPVASQPGHLAVVRPESTVGNIQIAQAGASNFEQGSITKGFGNKSPTYFVFDP